MRMQGPPSEQLTELYLRYSPSLHRRARALTGNPQEAEDLMQDTFLKFMTMQKEGALRGEASPYTVLFLIVTSKAIDRMRQRARWKGKLNLRDGEDFEGAEHSLDMAMEHEGDLSRVDAAHDLALLTEGETPEVLTAAYLFFVEGLSLTHVGQVLNLRRDEVSDVLKGFLKRARARRARLEGSDGEGSP
jgi:RNA polymerase sigma-70 factor (ECF subfamily)